MSASEERFGDIHLFDWLGSLLDTIRQRPAMYLGEYSLSALWFFLQGYDMCARRHGLDAPWEVAHRFADWVGYRLHLGGNFSGFWHKAILSKVRDEARALERFYDLRDEFLHREAKIVATIRPECREYPVKRRVTVKGDFQDFTELLPLSLQLVVYTDDPGFFLQAEDDENYFFNGWFVPALDSAIGFPSMRDRVDVIDADVWKRLLLENERWKKNLAQQRARIHRNKGKRKAPEAMRNADLPFESS